MVDHRGFPYTTYPTGWYQVAWSDEVPVGEPKPLRYFERDLVIYRGDSGEVHLFDAHCPHMGAHLGYGGSVQGDDIVCPYHGWRFDCNGCNAEIPYAERPNKTRLRTWTVREHASLVLMWYSDSGREPAWEPISVPEIMSNEYVAHPSFRRTWDAVRLKPQFIIENLVDAAHQKYVHGSYEIPEIDGYEADGPNFRVDSTIIFGQGKKKTWLTPDGKPRAAALRTEAWGMAVTSARFEIDSSIHVQTITPIDGEYCDSRATVMVPEANMVDGEPTEDALRRFNHECKQFDRDKPIWENMTFVHPAPFPPLEAKRFRDFRKWATQFYPDAVPGHFGKRQDFIGPADLRASATAS